MKQEIQQALAELYRQSKRFDIAEGPGKGAISLAKDGILLTNKSMDHSFFDPAGRVSIWDEANGNRYKRHLPVSIPSRLKLSILRDAAQLQIDPLVKYDVAIRGVDLEFVESTKVRGEMLLTFREREGDVPYTLTEGYKITINEIQSGSHPERIKGMYYFSRTSKLKVRCYSSGGSIPQWMTEVDKTGKFRVSSREYKSVEDFVVNTVTNSYFLDSYRAMGVERLKGRLYEYAAAAIQIAEFRNEKFTFSDMESYIDLAIENYRKQQ